MIGGEPLDGERRQLIESAGMRVVNRYATAEAGIVAAACGREPAVDAMHLYTDRAAALPSPDGLLLTSLTPFAGKVLLNASLGDHGDLSERRCDCGFGRLGISSWISGLGSEERLTIEGMTIRLASLHAIVARVLGAAGAPPDQSQLWRLPAADGGARLAVVVSPRITVDPEALIGAILEELGRQGELGRLTAEVWSQAGALQVLAAEPKLSPATSCCRWRARPEHGSVAEPDHGADLGSRGARQVVDEDDVDRETRSQQLLESIHDSAPHRADVATGAWHDPDRPAGTALLDNLIAEHVAVDLQHLRHQRRVQPLAPWHLQPIALALAAEGQQRQGPAARAATGHRASDVARAGPSAARCRG